MASDSANRGPFGSEPSASERLESKFPSRYRKNEAFADAIETFQQLGGPVVGPEIRDLLGTLAEHAPALLPLALSDASLLTDVFARPLIREDGAATFRPLFHRETRDLRDGDLLRRILRQLRHRAMVRAGLREILRLADVDQTSAELAALAAACTDAALAASLRTEGDRFGVPIGSNGEAIPITVLGMGKLGGGELNLGSDIDICFFYETDDGQVGDGLISVHEFFAKVASRTAKILSEVTDHGFCFRVDLRLRPEGSRGPVANSLASAERYYTTWGRTWERAALLRARPIAGDLEFGEELLAVLRPFIYQRTVDPSIADQMHDLLLRSRREQNVDSATDVKLGAGGIREAEFFIQSLQLIWGGHYPQVRVRGTIEAARRLAAAGLLGSGELEHFEQDWALLRRVEHRIHMWAGYQTHSLPSDREGFAVSLGFEDAAHLNTVLGLARRNMSARFASLREQSASSVHHERFGALCEAAATGQLEIVRDQIEILGIEDRDEAATHLARLARRANAPLGVERTAGFGELLLSEVAIAADPDLALRSLADFFSRLGGSWAYDKLLLENPHRARRLVSLFGASETLGSALVGHPEAIDQLLTTGGAPAPEGIDQIHSEERNLQATAPVEDFVAMLRTVKRECTLQIGLAYVGGEISLRHTEELLTTLADAQIRTAFHRATHDACERFSIDATQAPGMIVAGLGKLGGRELGFASDLDLVFLYDRDGEVPDSTRTWAEVFTRISQRTLHLLSQPDGAGPGYETDARLRPSGSKGMLVTSLASFDQYHETRAAPWERQALIRARAIAGNPELRAASERRFGAVAFERGPVEASIIAEMRGRMQRELGRESADHYHPKFGFGALIDIEFLVQSLQMRWGQLDPVRARHTRDALHQLVDAGRIRPGDGAALDEAYAFFSGVEHNRKLLSLRSEGPIRRGGRLALGIARRLHVRFRDGHDPTEVLFATWRRHAYETRGLFESYIAPVIEKPGWL